MRVALLFGGRSVEHEVSVDSARAVARAFDDTEHDCVPVAVDGDGRWLDPSRSADLLASDAARVPDGAGEALRVEPGRPALVGAEVDVVFPLVHGWGGEDGRLQGLLELTGLPYGGSGVLGSALAMDKGFAKRVTTAHGIPSVPWVELDAAAWADDAAACRGRVERALRPPLFVKPANGGSSVGISRVDDPRGLDDAVETALSHDRRVVVEQGVEARELEVAVLGNERPSASVVGEIVPSGTFYDYAAKYVDDASTLSVPARLDPAFAERIRELATASFVALDLAGFARVDFLLDRGDGSLYLNEANSLPGFTAISMFPRLWDASGVPFPALVERLVELALERHRSGARLRRRGPGRGRGGTDDA